MKVLVLGSGVIGTTVAYYLARAGHEVTVVDRQPGPALETSFANAGEVSPGYSSPWAGPGVPLKAVKWLLMQHSPLVIRPMLDPAMWRWGLQMLRNCTEARYARQQGPHGADRRVQPRLPEGAARRDRHRATTTARRARCNCSAPSSSWTASAKDIEILKEYGVPYEVLDRDGCVKVEPALARRAGEVRRCAAPARRRDRRLLQVHPSALAEMAEELGVTFRFGIDIEALEQQRRAHHRRATPTPAC